MRRLRDQYQEGERIEAKRNMLTRTGTIVWRGTSRFKFRDDKLGRVFTYHYTDIVQKLAPKTAVQYNLARPGPTPKAETPTDDFDPERQIADALAKFGPPKVK